MGIEEGEKKVEIDEEEVAFPGAEAEEEEDDIAPLPSKTELAPLWRKSTVRSRKSSVSFKKEFSINDSARKTFVSHESTESPDHALTYFDDLEGEDSGPVSAEFSMSPEPDDEDISDEHRLAWDDNKDLLKEAGVVWKKGKLPKDMRKHQNERREIFLEAAAWGKSAAGKANANRHITILYNPVSGAGIAKRLVEHMVEPVLKLAGCKFTTIQTEYRGFAIDFMLSLDPTKTDGILIAGGDGLVHEVCTGYFRRPDAAELDIPLGLVPSGTANAMAHELHAHDSKSHTALVGRAALAAARGRTRPVDVIATSLSDDPMDNVYALSVFGWGLAGTVAKAADDLRWIPGQKNFRYDLAGFVSMLKDWPPVCRCKISYPVEGQEEWKEEDISVTNFTATNLPWLGVDHPMTQDVAPDDGYLVIGWVPSTVSRPKIVRMGLSMKKGHFLFEHKAMRTIKVPEFRLTLDEDQDYNIDMLIDGDPHPPNHVHVQVLHQGLRVFAEPKTLVGPVMVKRKPQKKDRPYRVEPSTPASPIGKISIPLADHVPHYDADEDIPTPTTEPKKDKNSLTLRTYLV